MNPIMVLHHLSRGKSHQCQHVVEPVMIHNPDMITHVNSDDAQCICKISSTIEALLANFKEISMICTPN